MNAATEAEKKEDVRANGSDQASAVNVAPATAAPNPSTGVIVNINTGPKNNTTRKKNSSNSSKSNGNVTRNTKSVNAKPKVNSNANSNSTATAPAANAPAATGVAAAANASAPAATGVAAAANASAPAAPAANISVANAPATPANSVGKISSSELTIPFDNFDRYNTIWKMCKLELSKFKPLAEQNKGSDLSVVEDPESPGKCTLKSPTADLLKVLTPLDVLKQLNLFRYRDLLETTKTKEFSNTLDFFHEIEANREYCARACLTLCCLEEPDVKMEDVKDLKVSNLDIMDRKVFEKNKSGKPFSPYELTFLVNPLMVTLAEWEVDADWLGTKLYQEKYTNAILSDENFPAHLRLLSRYLNGAKESVMKKYPESFLMNYAHFYPLVLYPSGDEPKATETTEPADKPDTSSNTASQ